MQIRLRVLNGKSEGRELKVPYDEFLVGRSEECHLRPKSDSISRRHCVIRVRDEQAFVEDLGSRNGTHIDGVLTVGEQPLSNGAILKIGKLQFEVLLQESPVEKVAAESKSGGNQEDSWADDNDITKWLEEGASALSTSQGDPETRQFRLDETERAALETAAVNQAVTQTTVSSSSDSDSKSDSKVDKKEKKPGKLPPRNSATTANSREAAADMLKRFFNRP